MSINLKQLDDMVPDVAGEGFSLDGRDVYAIRSVARIDDIQDENGSVRIALSDSTARKTCVRGRGWMRAFQHGAVGKPCSQLGEMNQFRAETTLRSREHPVPAPRISCSVEYYPDVDDVSWAQTRGSLK